MQLRIWCPLRQLNQALRRTAILASCGVLGLRQNADYFLQAMIDWLALDRTDLSLAPTFPKVQTLALILQESRAVNHLLERDLEVYETVLGAMGGG